MKENINNQQAPKRNNVWLWILLGCAAVICGYCIWQSIKSEMMEPNSFTDNWQDSILIEDDSANSVVLDTIRTETNVGSGKETNSTSSSHSTTSSYDSYDDDEEEQNDDPEYRKGGKYDPALYHTDYGKDQEERRRRYIDNDGFDDDDGYDEYRGYEHENERSAQWDE